MNRRNFIKLGATASGVAVAGCGADGSAKASAEDIRVGHRKLGGTGLKVSTITFGGDGPENPELLLAALDLGINTIWTSPEYRDGRAQESVGRAIRAAERRQDEMVMFTGIELAKITTKQSVLDTIDGSLRRLGTDHLDIFAVFQVGSPRDLRTDALHEAIFEAKRAGKVGHLGLTGHSGDMEACLEAAIEDGRFDVFCIRYDFVSYPNQGRILHRAAEKGIGTMVFKVNAGNRHRELEDLASGGRHFNQAAVKWALTNPDVASVCIRITNFDQLRDYAAAVGTALEKSEVAMLSRYADEMYDKYCRFCGTCESSCPHHVSVADVNRFAMYFKYYGREKEAMQLYRSLPGNRSAAMCDACEGSCDRACPFGRAVQTELVEAHNLLSFSHA
jgi:aryl-alcohol dehydrogenase-like predicted oxidoreductase